MSLNQHAQRLESVWLAMAEHFLDTETRHDIPRTALCCVEAGLTSEPAQRVWQDDISPAVGMNLWSVAGARDLELLARSYFDFCPPRSNLPHAQLARLRELRSGPFFEIVEPATQMTEKFAARRRVDVALEVAQ